MRLSRIELCDYPFHIFVRGNNRQALFHDDADHLRYLSILRAAQKRFDFLLYTYALMDNHIHLLLQMQKGLLSSLMHWVQLGYARYFNGKYSRVGHVFQSRYNARLVEKDRYFLTADRYIHLNPVRAGIVVRPEDFHWSSYRSRLGLVNNSLVEHETVLSYFGTGADRIAKYRRFTEEAVTRPEEWTDQQLLRSRYLGSRLFFERAIHGDRGEPMLVLGSSAKLKMNTDGLLDQVQ